VNVLGAESVHPPAVGIGPAKSEKSARCELNVP
jgi:hypothetical protein